MSKVSFRFGRTILPFAGGLLVTALAVVTYLSIIAGVILGVFWLIWSLWCFVVPALFPSIAPQFADPSYWLFVAAWILVGLVSRVVFRGLRPSSK